jgi:hypothetical protein
MSIPTDLTTAKAAKMDAVGSTTRDLLGYGFEYASARFSLDTDGSDVFAALAALHYAGASPPYPPALDTNGVEMNLADAASLEAFVEAGVVYRSEVMDGHIALVSQIAACTTVGAVDAITDDRAEVPPEMTPPLVAGTVNNPAPAPDKPKPKVRWKLHCVDLGDKVFPGVCGSRVRNCTLFQTTTATISPCPEAERCCQTCNFFRQGEYKKPEPPPARKNPKLVYPVAVKPAEGPRSGPRLLLSAAVGANGKKWLEITRPLMETYAAKCGAAFEVITDGDESYPLGEKWRIAEYLGRYDRVVFLDADVVVAPDTPDLFNLVPSTHVGVRDDWPWSCVQSGTNVLRAWLDPEIRAIRKAANRPGPLLSTVYNTGVLVLSSQHAGLFDPPKVPLPKFHCTEQHWFNLNVMDQQPAVYELPWELHWHPFIDRKRERTAGVKVWHLAGESDRAEKLKRLVSEIAGS